MFQLIKNMNENHIPFIYINVVFLLSTTLPISWYTISVIYLYGTLLLFSLFVEIFRIVTEPEAIFSFILPVIFGLLGVDAIAILPMACSTYR